MLKSLCCHYLGNAGWWRRWQDNDNEEYFFQMAWCETFNLASHHVNSHFFIININIIIFIIIFITITIAIIITITTIMMLVRYIVAYLLYLAGGCIIFESIEEAAESESKSNSNPTIIFLLYQKRINSIDIWHWTLPLHVYKDVWQCIAYFIVQVSWSRRLLQKRWFLKIQFELELDTVQSLDSRQYFHFWHPGGIFSSAPGGGAARAWTTYRRNPFQVGLPSQILRVT